MAEVYVSPGMAGEYAKLSKCGGAVFVGLGLLTLPAPLFLPLFGFAIPIVCFLVAYGMVREEDWAPRGGGLWAAALLPGTLLIALMGFVGTSIYLVVPWLAGLLCLCIAGMHLSSSIRKILVSSAEKRKGMAYPHSVSGCPVCGATKVKFVDGVMWECANCGSRH